MPEKKKPKKKGIVRRKSRAKVEEALSKLTVKERRLVENIIAGKSRTEAVIRAGYDVGDPNSRKDRKKACDIAAHALAKPEVKEAFSALLDRHNLSISRLLTKINEGLDATKVVAVMQLPPPKTGEESKAGNELVEAGHRTTDYVEVPDHVTRHKYIETALSLHGLPEKKKGEGAGEDLPYHERIKLIWASIEGEAPIGVTAREVGRGEG